MRSLNPRSFKQIRLALFFPLAPGGTGAAGPCRLAFANDNARLRLFPDFPNRVLRLAGRLALAQLWPIILPGRAVAAAGHPHTRLVIKPIPGRMVVACSAYPLSVRSSHLVALRCEEQLTTGAFAGVGQPISELGKVADHERRH